MTEQFLAPKYLSFASVLDAAARQQLTGTASMPFVYPHLASMPDVHLGKGCAVGTVLPRNGPSSRPRWAWTSAAG